MSDMKILFEGVLGFLESEGVDLKSLRFSFLEYPSERISLANVCLSPTRIDRGRRADEWNTFIQCDGQTIS
jgi:hypothetical protein